MKKHIVALILTCVCFFTTYAQPTCKDCVYNLYEILATQRAEYIDIGENTYSVKALYQDKCDSVIVKAIIKANVFSYGSPLDSVVELDLGNKALYFMVNTEPPRSFRYSEINNIYDSKGRNLLYADDYMKFPAVINDPDGFTYVRARPSSKSKAKTTIYRNQIFLYTPLWGSNWYRAYSSDGSSFIGYIYSNRILPYDKCPMGIKKKMTKLIFD